MKKLWNRESLKSFFRKGQFPSQVHFEYLIDSTVNQLDDGFAKTDKDGLQLAPTGDTNNVLSIFNNLGEQRPSWQLSLKGDDNGSGLTFDRLRENADGNMEKTSSLVFADNGNVGIGTSQPRTNLEVGSVLGVHTRVGTFRCGQVPGDGEWHHVLPGLTGVHAFEIVARIDGGPGRAKYALTHATALSTFGGSHQRIKQVRAYYGWFLNRIEFRWHGKETRNYSLQVRTRRSYGLSPEGTNYMIRFHVTQLWDESLFLNT